MTPRVADTIFALSTGRPPAAIAVIRISGPAAQDTLATLADSLPPPRRAALRRLRDRDGSLLDEALVIHFPGPRSATGEDLVELHCHGGRAVVAAIERALAAMPGLRAAEAGEFTRRALLHGRIDLAEAQGLADLLAAETEAQRQVALGTASGRLSRAVTQWLERVALLSAEAEAALDYADEDDVLAHGSGLDHMHRRMEELGREITDVLAAPPVDRLRDGIRVVLAGPPNSGKSTLLNLMTEREAAIVSPIAGTTRDRVEVPVSRAGLPFILIDTAGLHDNSSDPIERIGMDRARAAVDEADIVLWLGDDRPIVSEAIWVHTRADVPGRNELPPEKDIATRLDDRRSVDSLWEILFIRAKRLVPRPDQLALDRSQRQHSAAAAEALLTSWNDPLIGAEMLRQAHLSLGAILGINATEAMLDALFGRFCIGK